MRIHRSICTGLVLAAALGGCSPKFDWRDYRGADAPYAVLFPGKPATYSRTVNLDGTQASMTMAAAEIDGTMFAVGSAQFTDTAQAQVALQAMKTAMVRNIGGTVDREAARDGGVDLTAHGVSAGRPMALHGRFIARGKYAYQAIVIGPTRATDTEQIETFLQSFKPG